MTTFDYKKLKSGTDIRGVAVQTEEHDVELTDKAVYDLTGGFCAFLLSRGVKQGARVAVGHDSRISAERIKAQVISALRDFGFFALDCGLASTPAMFMTTVDFNCISTRSLKTPRLFPRQALCAAALTRRIICRCMRPGCAE